MNPAAASTRLWLQRGQSYRLAEPGRRRLASAAGTLWVTIDHDRRDIVLEPGQGLALAGDAPVLIGALGGPALLDLAPAGAEVA